MAKCERCGGEGLTMGVLCGCCGEPPVALQRLVSQQRLEALVKAERVLDVMYGFYRHRGPWETMSGTQTLEEVRRAIALANTKLKDR